MKSLKFTEKEKNVVIDALAFLKNILNLEISSFGGISNTYTNYCRNQQELCMSISEKLELMAC